MTLQPQTVKDNHQRIWTHESAMITLTRNFTWDQRTELNQASISKWVDLEVPMAELTSHQQDLTIMFQDDTVFFAVRSTSEKTLSDVLEFGKSKGFRHSGHPLMFGIANTEQYDAGIAIFHIKSEVEALTSEMIPFDFSARAAIVVLSTNQLANTIERKEQLDVAMAWLPGDAIVYDTGCDKRENQINTLSVRAPWQQTLTAADHDRRPPHL